MSNDKLTMDHIDLGLVPYREALEIQHHHHRLVVEKLHPGFILSVEHPAVITMGRRGLTPSLLVDPQQLASQGIELVATERGGDVTAHNPGQLVIYPILPQSTNLTPRRLVWALEQAVIDTLAGSGIEGSRSQVNPGVWVGSSKICAIGLRIKQRVSFHGLALNINNDLKIFQNIVPCGLNGYQVTRMLDQLPPSDPKDGPEITISEITSHFLEHFSKNLPAPPL